MGYIPPAPYGFTHEDNAPSRQDEDRREARRSRPMPRVAFVNGLGDDDADRVAPYLPINYGVAAGSFGLFIVGYDVAGWTLDGYVIPRLASGLIFATEVK